MATEEIYQAIVTYKKAKVAELVRSEIDAGTDVNKILLEGLIAPLDEIGEKFSSGELFVPEMLAAAHSMKEGLKVLRPLLAQAGASKVGTVVIGTVKGDLHDIGKNIVGMMLEGAGFEVIDLGVDVEPERFASVALERNVQIIALSALLTTTMPSMKATVEFLHEQCSDVKIIVGGAPITEDFARQIGADGFSVDAPSAVRVARELLNLGT